MSPLLRASPRGTHLRWCVLCACVRIDCASPAGPQRVLQVDGVATSYFSGDLTGHYELADASDAWDTFYMWTGDAYGSERVIVRAGVYAQRPVRVVL